jgi:DNA-binding SARP family transcriptional activator
VLGPVQVLRDGRLVPPGGPTTLTLLAGLAVMPHRVVSVDTLIDYVWGGLNCTSGAGYPARCSRS